MSHKCQHCRYRGEYREPKFQPFGVCTREINLIDAEKAYNAPVCPYKKKGELLICPFCGGVAKFHACAELENATMRTLYTGKWGVHCPNCHVATPPYDSKEQAADAWNRRESK